MTADVVRAVNMPKEIRAVQEAVYEKETERLSYEEKATGEKFEELMRNYIEEDKYHQYLVDGAVLRCTAATTDDFTYAEGETVVWKIRMMRCVILPWMSMKIQCLSII